MEEEIHSKEHIREKLREEIQDSTLTSIINLINYIVELAHFLGASDIHIDPEEKKIRVSMRVDGLLHDELPFPKLLQAEIISRIKILAGLKTDEHQIPQDGRFRLSIADELINVRVSIVPTYYGENAVLRLLKNQHETVNLEHLGFSIDERIKITRSMQRPYGMILATGPTGSGKTTTLYALIKMLDTKRTSVITIEDPIEYSLFGINQIGVNLKAGLTFANGLRSMLRQDPNSIMVGEIRDRETASLAINAALTGHLILSTLHTNDAAATIPRLMDLGIEPYLIASTISLVIAQRLARKICANCKEKLEATDEEMERFRAWMPPAAGKEFYRGKGCFQCDNTGYKGRISINEVLVISTSIASAIHQKHSTADIRAIAQREGMARMAEDGFQKAANGITTVEEILRILHE